MGKNMNPTISVVMPVFNAERFLSQAIESILRQSWTDFEFIIINDGSSDSSLEIIRRYAEDNRIVVISRENRGLIYSLNEGIGIARGEYIARMDADDVSLPERLEKQLSYMKANNLEICGCHYFLINEHDAYVDSFIVPLSKESFFRFLSITTPFAHPSVMIKKSVLTDYGLAYGKTDFIHAEDYALWIELWKQGVVFGNVDDFLFKYRDFSTSVSKQNIKKVSKDAWILSKNFITENKNKLFEDFLKSDLKNCPRKEQEISAVIVWKLILYDFSFKYFQVLRKISSKYLLYGFFKILNDMRR